MPDLVFLAKFSLPGLFWPRKKVFHCFHGAVKIKRASRSLAKTSFRLGPESDPNGPKPDSYGHSLGLGPESGSNRSESKIGSFGLFFGVASEIYPK